MSFHNLRGKLVDGEKVIKEWVSKDWSGIYATQYRLFLVDDRFYNKRSVEVPYVNISCLEFMKNRPKERLISSIISMGLFIISSFVSTNRSFYYLIDRNMLTTLSYFFLLLSLGLFVWFIIGNDTLRIHIDGTKPIDVSKELVELYYFARLHLKTKNYYPNNLDSTESNYQHDRLVNVT